MKKLALHAIHERLGARFAPFAGYEMPLQYSGIVDEHNAVRSAVGLFDVSHMGNFELRGPEAIAAIDRIVTNDISALEDGQAAYTVMCVETGGIVDDLIVYRRAADDVLLIVNASRKDIDWAHIQDHLAGDVEMTDRSDDLSLLAVQGPAAEALLDGIVDADLRALEGFRATTATLSGTEVSLFVARTGYTGEDGFEVLVDNQDAATLAEAILSAGEAHGLKPCGLGARDTLRLESKFPLYGNEIDLETNPLEAGLGWVVKLRKDAGFVGRDALRAVRTAGVTRRLRAVKLVGRGVLRAGYALWVGEEEVGALTSGNMGPTVGFGVGIGYIDIEHCAATEGVEVEIRGRRLPVIVSKRAFYKPE